MDTEETSKNKQQYTVQNISSLNQQSEINTQSQKQVFNNKNNNSSPESSQQSGAPNSPRRPKQTLNLDEALYLQSQARNVQEPNEKKAPVNRSCQRTIIQHSIGHCTSSHHQQATHSANSQTLHSNPKIIPKSCPSPSNHRVAYLKQQPISVDYIDCLSNTDLIAQQQQHPMRGISSFHCKKHLRFHRNRVEPATNAISDTTTLDCQQQQQQQDQQQQQQAFDDGATTTNTAEDSFSNVLSSICSASLNEHDNQQATGNPSSVLYPISVSEVKKSTYLIGSLGQDSLTGHDELYRHFPSGKVNIFVCTWNQNRKRAPLNLSDLLLPEQVVYLPDIYAIGIQEAFSSHSDYLREWDIELQTTLGASHVLLHSCTLGVLHLSLFIRRDLIWFCSTPEESLYNSRSMPTNMIGTKGAVSIAFRFFGTSFMFTNCHFPAHENKLKERVDEYQRIIQSIDLPKNLKLLKPRYLSNDSTARFDCVFFMGDLNFRLEQRSFDETIQILDDIFHNKQNNITAGHASSTLSSSSASYEALTQYDELLKVMESNQAFHGFDESQIRFPPTYKFLPQTNKYDRATKRVPSYTDRILFRSKRQRHIQCLIYDWLPQMISSDHKPVYSLFNVLIRPGGHEQHNLVGSLNAGLFQRAIYLEALKRRAEDPDSMARENGAVGGSLICSIS